MKISLEQNRKRLQENKKRLNEGTSNFWSMDNFPLLVFDYYEDVSDQIVDELKNEHEEFKDMKYWEIQDTPEYEEAWDKVKVCVLDESQVDELEKDIDEFNRNARYDDRYDDYEDTEIKVEIKPGYYQAAQIYVNDEDYLQDWQIEEVNKFLKELKEKYHLTQLSIAYRFSNGETGYDIANEGLGTGTDRKIYKEAAKKANPAMKYKESANNTNDMEDKEKGNEDEENDEEVNPSEDSKEEVVEGYFEEVDEELWEEFKKFKKIYESINFKTDLSVSSCGSSNSVYKKM